MKYRKKPVVIDAIQWNGGNQECLNDFCGRDWARADAVDAEPFNDPEQVVLWNKEERQWLNCPVGHWIIRGVKGEYYSCSPDVFEQTYESVK